MSTKNLEQDVTQKGASRRAFLASATGVGSAWVVTNWAGILKAQEHAAHAAAHGGKFEFFSHEQAMEVEAVAAQIIPTDDTPGAREAGCVYFIDRALTTFDKAHQHVYQDGLPMLQTKSHEMFPKAAKFSALTSDEQMRVLEAIEKTPFFQQVRVHTITGFFAEPQEGGNRNEVGWKLIGFEGKFHYSPPFGYYDRESEAGASGGGGNHGQI